MDLDWSMHECNDRRLIGAARASDSRSHVLTVFDLGPRRSRDMHRSERVP